MLEITQLQELLGLLEFPLQEHLLQEHLLLELLELVRHLLLVLVLRMYMGYCCTLGMFVHLPYDFWLD